MSMIDAALTSTMKIGKTNFALLDWTQQSNLSTAQVVQIRKLKI